MFRPASLLRARRAPLSRRAPLVAGAVALVALSACGPSNRLREIDLDGRRVAVTAAIPPSPRVQAGSPAERGVDLYDPIGTIARLGTAAGKSREMRRAQARLDSAAAEVDVAERMARRLVARSAEALRFETARRPAEADFVLDLRVYDHALVADSFEGATYFVVEGAVLLTDAATGRELWDAEVREREVLTGTLFGLPAAAGNVVTARALAGLSSAEMERGLARLADATAERIAERLRHDYARSRR